MNPSSDAAIFSVTNGTSCFTVQVKRSIIPRASASSSTSTAMPCSRSARTPPPAVRGFGSSTPITTRATPAAISASVHGAVRP